MQRGDKKTHQKSHRKGMKRRLNAKKKAEKRERWLKNRLSAIQSQIEATKDKLSNLEDPSWVAQFIQREQTVAQNRLSSLEEERKLASADLAGVQIELARKRKLAEEPEKEVA